MRLKGGERLYLSKLSCEMKITVLDGYTLNPGDLSWAPLESFGELTVYDRTAPDQVIARAADADILLTNKTALSAETIAQLPQLQFVSVMATGFNVVDLDPLKARSIPVSNVPEYSTDSVAQYVFAGLLGMAHQLGRHDQAIRDGEWVKRKDFSFCLTPQMELVGKTIGIVGFGRIGRRVGEIANAFGMKVWASISRDPKKLRPPYTGFAWKSVEAIFKGADVVTLHYPLTNENQGFVGQDLLHTMKPTAFLINAARGGLVNETELANALNQNHLAGACLDVTSTEPIEPENPLLQAKNCLLTPHYAWATIEARTRLLETTTDNIRAFVSGTPIHVVS